MKLVEILARELEEWPDHKGTVLAIVQDPDMMAYIRAFGDADEFAFRGGQWVGVWHNHVTARPLSELATDYSTAIVTRADWEAERANINAALVITASKPKANGDGWIRHRGGKCPVEAGTLVEVRNRAGDIALTGAGSCTSVSWHWSHDKHPGDIMVYKIHKPAEQPALVSEETIKATEPGTPDTMLAIRDRIRALDTQRAEVESTYQRQISEITQERESLVQKLAGEGLALVEVVAQPVGDMSDYQYWKRGDLLECVSLDGRLVSDLTLGNLYKYLGFGSILDDTGCEQSYPVKFGGCFKWHSRPAS